MEYLGFIAVFSLFMLLVGCLFSITQPIQYTPMTPDEEFKWLTEEQGLTKEQAEDIMGDKK